MLSQLLDGPPTTGQLNSSSSQSSLNSGVSGSGGSFLAKFDKRKLKTVSTQFIDESKDPSGVEERITSGKLVPANAGQVVPGGRWDWLLPRRNV